MNKKQLITLWVGISIIVLMGIYPPYFISMPMNPRAGRTEYHFLFKTVFFRVDIAKLLIQWFIVAFIITGLLFTFKVSGSGTSTLAASLRHCWHGWLKDFCIIAGFILAILLVIIIIKAQQTL